MAVRVGGRGREVEALPRGQLDERRGLVPRRGASGSSGPCRRRPRPRRPSRARRRSRGRRRARRRSPGARPRRCRRARRGRDAAREVRAAPRRRAAAAPSSIAPATSSRICSGVKPLEQHQPVLGRLAHRLGAGAAGDEQELPERRLGEIDVADHAVLAERAGAARACSSGAAACGRGRRTRRRAPSGRVYVARVEAPPYSVARVEVPARPGRGRTSDRVAVEEPLEIRIDGSRASP